MAIVPWKELTREQVFKKYSRAIDKVDFELPNGEKADFYIKAEAPAASIFAMTKDDNIILAKQFRPGPNKILNELPGGYLEPGENALQSISREFLEETGYEGDFIKIGTCLDDAYSTMVRHCFVATNCKKIADPKITNTEQTELVLMPLNEFRTFLRTGQLTDVEVAYLALDYLGKL
ncbi:MAG: NUDIX hydrolase [Patescibacteria group bacterium]|jgi:ADP-ribose pyrophosphatase|nr:NUDIX hydrolase [Patescibacteria group bacterium]